MSHAPSYISAKQQRIALASNPWDTVGQCKFSQLNPCTNHATLREYHGPHDLQSITSADSEHCHFFCENHWNELLAEKDQRNRIAAHECGAI
jgi:hypothetical protein